MTEKLSNLKNSIGKRVNLVYNKTGYLRYCGNVLFAKGLWCGIELDDNSGDNDGSVNNIRYFSCKENHGLFIPASEIDVTGDVLLIKNTKILSWSSEKSNDKNTCIVFKEISKAVDELDSSKENFDIMSEEFVTASDLDLGMDSSFEEHFDSDESLGLLPLDLFDEKNSEDDLILEREKLFTEANNQRNEQFEDIFINEEYVLPFAKNPFKQDFFTKLDVINEDSSVLKATDNLLTGHVTSVVPKTTANILSEEQENLNVTVTFRDRTFEINEFKIDDEKTSIVQDISSSSSSVSKILSVPASDVNSPKYSSTPKHESNYTFNLDEEILKNMLSTHTSSPVFDPNKTTIIKENVIEENTEAVQSDELDHGNILSNQTVPTNADVKRDSEKNINITCNVHDSLYASESNLNETFDVVSDTTFSTTFESKNKTFNLKEDDNITQKIEVSCSDEAKNVECQYNKNIQANLNTTISLPDDLKEQLDSNTQSSDSFLEENWGHQVYKNTSNNDLNTTISISKKPENKSKAFGLEKEKHVHGTKTLNTTYEKIDQISQLPESVKPPEVQKQHLIKQTGNSKIAKRIYNNPFSTTASSNKYSELNKNKHRKSEGVSKEKNILMKKNANRRQTFGSISSEIDDSVQSCKSSSQVSQRQPSHPTTSDSKSLKTGSSLSHDDSITKKCSTKEATEKPKISSLRQLVQPGTTSRGKAVYSGETQEKKSTLSRMPDKRVLFQKNGGTNPSCAVKQNLDTKSGISAPVRSKIPATGSSASKKKDSEVPVRSKIPAIFSSGSKKEDSEVPVKSKIPAVFSSGSKKKDSEESSDESESEKKIPKKNAPTRRNLR